MDLLGDVLEGLRLESSVFCHAEFSAPWGFSKAALEGAPFHAVVSGQAWVVLVDARPLALDQGDFVVLPHGDAHLLLHAPDAPATSFTDLLTERGAELWRPGQRGPTSPPRLPGRSRNRSVVRLAPWQAKRAADYLEERLDEDFCLTKLRLTSGCRPSISRELSSAPPACRPIVI